MQTSADAQLNANFILMGAFNKTSLPRRKDNSKLGMRNERNENGIGRLKNIEEATQKSYSQQTGDEEARKQTTHTYLTGRSTGHRASRAEGIAKMQAVGRRKGARGCAITSL